VPPGRRLGLVPREDRRPARRGIDLIRAKDLVRRVPCAQDLTLFSEAPMTSPRDFECPYCKAPVGSPCKRPSEHTDSNGMVPTAEVDEQRSVEV
jgi:hypothetical protein